jgi:hypothetical protein
MSSALRERGASDLAPRPDLAVVPRPRRRPGPKTALVGLYALAWGYHWLQARAHLTPAVFGDELLYSKLAQSLAAGDGFTIRGETIFFPAPLSILAQAPAWLLDSTPAAYAAAKGLNTALMAAAVFPAYFLARRLLRPSYALLVAAVTVSGPPMLYGAYLMSEALAYPVFLLAFATMLRALERPSRVMEFAVVGASAMAVATRLQFVVVPLAYLLAVPVSARLRRTPVVETLRRHRLSLAVLGAALPLAAAVALLGTYEGAAFLDYDLGSTLAWTARNAALLPFAAGLLIVPGALVGLALLATRPRNRAEAGFAALALGVSALVLVEVGLISAADAARELERYAIYVVPLAAVAFFAYAERGAPSRKAYAGLALLGAATAWLMPFPATAGTAFSFDAPTLSAYAQLAAWTGHANAATVYAGVPLLGGIALALVSLRRSGTAAAVGVATAALLFLSGVAAYAGDHAMTRGALDRRAAEPPDWLDRSGLGPADYLQLPGGSAHYGWLLEAWNRSFRKPVHLGAGGDWFASSNARIAPDGRLFVDGRAPTTSILIVNDFGTTIELDGDVVARPRDGLTAYRLRRNPRVRLLAEGLGFDRWAAGLVDVRVWSRAPVRSGVYRVDLRLPAGRQPRIVMLTVSRGARRAIRLAGGESRRVEIAAEGYPVPPLRIATDHADAVDAGTADARLVAVRIPGLSFEPKG